MFLFFFFICCLSASLTQSADCFNNKKKKREDNANEKKKKTERLRFRTPFFFFSNSAFCLCEQKSYKCRRACNTMYARTFAMRATLSAAPLHLVAASFNYQRGPMLFFFVCRLPPFGKTISVPRHQKQLQLLAFFFFSPTLLLCHFRHERSTSQKSVFFFSSSPLYSVIPFKHIYIFFAKCLRHKRVV